MLGFLRANPLKTVRQTGLQVVKQAQIAITCIAECTDFWNRREEPLPDFAALLAPPERLQERVAAGVELLVRKGNVAW